MCAGFVRDESTLVAVFVRLVLATLSHLLTRVVCWTQIFKKCDFWVVYDDKHFVIRYGKIIKLLRERFIKSTEEKIARQIQLIHISKIKDGGGMLSSKVSADKPHLLIGNFSKLMIAFVCRS